MTTSQAPQSGSASGLCASSRTVLDLAAGEEAR
jgi:hypothetical protein